MALTERELKIHLAKARRDSPDARVYAFHWNGGELPVERVEAAGCQWRLRSAPSELAIRDALESAESSVSGNGERDGGQMTERLALLTPLKNSDVGYDTLARLADTEIAQFDPWESIQHLFGASSVDSRLRNDQEMRPLGEALMVCSTREGQFEPVSSGMLGLDAAWRAFYRSGLSFNGAEGDLSDWLLWGLDNPDGVAALVGEFSEVLEPLGERLADQIGPEGRLFGTMIVEEEHRAGASEPGPSAPGLQTFAAGLAIDAIRRARSAGQAETASIEALTRLKDRYDSGEKPSADAMEAVGRAAVNGWERLKLRNNVDNGEGAPEKAGRLERIREVGRVLDDLLTDLVGGDAAELLAVSPASRAGWRTRVESTAEAVFDALDGERSALDLSERLEDLETHFAAQSEPSTFEALRDAARLACWLEQREHHYEGSPEDLGLADLARKFTAHGSFADLLRERLTSGDIGAEGQRVVDRAVRGSLDYSEQLNERFSELLASELRDRTEPRGALGIHQVLQEVVAPLAERKPVLVAVMDGMSWGVSRALLADPKLDSWGAWVPALADGEDVRELPVFATLPSTTRNSRASLLTGKLQSGQQSTESDGFARRLRDLGAVQRLEDAPLFHKAEVDADGRGSLGSEVREALENEDRRVVGTVINTIDDQLSGAEQLSVDWSVDTVTPLRSLLDYARHRTIVLVSDHGHVWETDSDRDADVSSTSARWRPSNGGVVEGEREFEGPMIRQLTGEESITAAWSEQLRYTRGQAGYHGGASLQEIVTPLVVLDRDGEGIEELGFTGLTTAEPSWWRVEEPTKKAELPDAEETHAEEDSEGSAQLDLLDEDSEVAALDTDWILQLVETELFQEQLERHGAGIEAEAIAKLLAHLQANGDRLPLAAVARLFNRSKSRAKSFLTVVREVLNLEGYQALRVASLEGMVELDRSRLTRQFGLRE